MSAARKSKARYKEMPSQNAPINCNILFASTGKGKIPSMIDEAINTIIPM